MKKKIVTILMSIMILATVTACSKKAGDTPVVTPEPTVPAAAGSETDSSNTANTEKKDSVQSVNALLSFEPSVLDVSRFSNVSDGTVLYDILEPLTRVENGELTPAGAESWDISKDGLEYTFHLRENYWSDGQKVTAADYVNTIIRDADPKTAYAFASDLFSIKNFEAVYNGTEDKSKLGVEIIDESTFKLYLQYPSPSLLTTAVFFPQRSDYLKKYGDKLGTEADSVISCGPFVLDSWVHNSKLTFTKNEDYWDAKNVSLQKYTYLIITDPSAQYASLENGSLDWLSVSDADYINKFRERSDLTETPLNTGRTSMIVFNCQNELFKNKKVRLAFSLSIDRKTISEALNNGLTTPAYGLITPLNLVGKFNFRNEVEEPLLSISKQYSDPKALLVEGLKELGQNSDPSKLSLTLNLGGTDERTKSLGEYYQQMWEKALGVKVELVFNDTATHLALLREGDFQFGSASWGSTIEPQFQLSRWVGGGQSHWINKDYDKLVSQASQALDEKERLSLYAEAEKLLISDVAIAPISYSGTLLFTYNYVRGIGENSLDNTGMKTIYTVGK